MKLFILLNLFLLSLSVPGVADASVLSEKTGAGVIVSSFVIENVNGLESDQYICLGTGWEKSNFVVYAHIRDLRKVFHNLFQDLGSNEKNCFAPSKVPKSARRTMDEILERIDAGAADQFHITVGADGRATLTNQKSIDDHIDYQELGQDNFILRNEESTLGTKLLRAESVVGGIEVLKLGALIALPKSITNWKEGWQKDIKGNYVRAWTQAPVLDSDSFMINYIGHPYGGSIYYNALRSQGGTRLQSLLFTTVQSTFWEYGIEAMAEKPSIQDLVVTPLVGSFIGELAHMGTMRMKLNGFNFFEKVLVTVINPTFIINNGYK